MQAAQPDDDIATSDERERLERALSVAPRGAFALAGTTLLLLLIGWFLFYFLVFIPRGVVG
jgi:hypothetical protein